MNSMDLLGSSALDEPAFRPADALPAALVTEIAAVRPDFEILDRMKSVADAFASEGWISHCEALAEAMSSAGRGTVTTGLRSIYRVLVRGFDAESWMTIPLQEVRRVARSGRLPCVLDFGGGFGDNYHRAERALGASNELNWSIVDNERSGDLGRKLHPANPRLKFHTSVPDEIYDIALIIGTLQYVPDWRAALAAIASRGNPKIYTTRTPIRRTGKGFLVLQQVRPKLGAFAGRVAGEANVRIFSRSELDHAMADLGYHLERIGGSFDYGRCLTSLPETHRDVDYIDMLWVHA